MVTLDHHPLHLEIYTRPGCHLCEELRAVCDRMESEFCLRLTEVNIDASPALQARFGLEIPVLFIDGRKAVKYRTTEEKLRRILRRRRLLRQFFGN